MVIIAGFGNPLLDVTVKVNDKHLLQKYNLQDDDEQVTDEGTIKCLLNDISNLEFSLSPGGCVQNTLRICQWILSQIHATAMFGTIGLDQQGEKLKNIIEESGIKIMYNVHPLEQTGTAVALVNDLNRSLIAYIGAAKYYTVEDLHTESKLAMLKTTNFVYLESFFLPERLAVSQSIKQICYDNHITFAFNLCAIFMSDQYPLDMLHFAETCDVLIGNYKEYESLIKNTKLKCSVIEFATKLSYSFKSEKKLKFGKIVVITNGPESIFCVHSSGKIEELQPQKIEESKIRDTIGAGDAFAAGFFCALLAGKSVYMCLKWGCWVAQQIIQQKGCTLPECSSNALYNLT